MANKNVNDPRLLLIDCITRKLEKMDICTLRLVYNDITKRLDKKRKDDSVGV